jgi:CheY-like chemotaxis protein
MKIDENQRKFASFKIKEKLWNEFVKTVYKNGSSTTNVLEDFIEQYITENCAPQPRTAVNALIAQIREPSARSKLPESLTIGAKESNSVLDLTGIHVLVLDDEINIRISITSILEHYGATVTAIASPTVAIQTLQAEPQKYHVLLSDIGMPEQDGWSFIRQVRALSPEAGGTIPAAALTTYSSPREINIAKQLGFQVHISKPIDATLLASIVADLFDRSIDSRSVNL